jgi:hypothetical protein
MTTTSTARAPFLDACFDLAIFAPTSHSLECWQMIDVRDQKRLFALRHLCQNTKRNR